MLQGQQEFYTILDENKRLSAENTILREWNESAELVFEDLGVTYSLVVSRQSLGE